MLMPWSLPRGSTIAARCSSLVPPSSFTQASADHFVLILAPGSSKKVTYKRAGEVAPGDIMWVATGQQDMAEAVVVAADTVTNTGLYAPLTLGGTIMVNNVAASVHRSVDREGGTRVAGRDQGRAGGRQGACPLPSEGGNF